MEVSFVARISLGWRNGHGTEMIEERCKKKLSLGFHKIMVYIVTALKKEQLRNLPRMLWKMGGQDISGEAESNLSS